MPCERFASTDRYVRGSNVLIAGMSLPYWVIVTEPAVLEPPGTIRVINRAQLEDGRIRWLVEGANIMGVLPGLARGVVSVKRVPNGTTSRSTINRW